MVAPPPFIPGPVSLYTSEPGDSSTQELWSYYSALGTMLHAGDMKINHMLGPQGAPSLIQILFDSLFLA